MAINPATGAIEWQTGAGFPATADWSGNSAGQLFVNDGVLFATAEVALDGLGGKMMALDANTGKVLWSFEPPGSYLQSSPAIVQGIVYWGSGLGRVATSLSAERDLRRSTPSPSTATATFKAR